MDFFTKQNWQIKRVSIFPKNDTWIHTKLQIMFVAGCILFVIGRYSK